MRRLLIIRLGCPDIRGYLILPARLEVMAVHAVADCEGRRTGREWRIPRTDSTISRKAYEHFIDRRRDRMGRRGSAAHCLCSCFHRKMAGNHSCLPVLEYRRWRALGHQHYLLSSIPFGLCKHRVDRDCVVCNRPNEAATTARSARLRSSSSRRPIEATHAAEIGVHSE